MKLSRKSMVFTFFVSLFVLLTGASVADAKPALRRFALIVGANNGGAERVLLRYAVSDARAFSEVLHTLGGVAPGDSLILLNPDKSDFISGFDRLGELVERGQGSADRTEVVVYYSGHSDEQGLLLGEHRLKYSWLRRHLKRLGADVRIVVLDSCSSGALTRRKGGTLLPPFVLDTSSKVSGHAFITSSSATEAAQESDAIAGSFFTHYLVSGLRGAADTNGDGRVTLTEAYQFAFDETLARTESTQSGPQHPNYDFQLAGAGNLVMTDLSTSTARLMLDASLTGRVSVRDSDGHLVAELRKMQGKVVSLGLSPGRYQVSIATTQGLLGGTIDIKAGHLGHLGEMTLESIDLERAVPRGGLLEKELGLSEEYEVQEMCLGLFPGFGTCPGLRKKVIRKTSLSLFWDHAERIDGLQASAIVSVATEDLSGLQASAVANLNGGALDGVQLAGAVNLTRGSAIGIQGAGAVNVLVGSLRGAQFAGAVSVLGGNAPKALQASGALNLALSDEYRGWQVSGAANILKGDLLSGVQIAGALNYAGRLDGAQIAVLNITGDLDGAQIGIVNIARNVKGTQVGILNISNDYKSGMPVGLFNFVRKGPVHLDVWGNDVLTTNASLKFGSDKFYSLLTVGNRPQMGNDQSILGYGVGVGRMVHFSEQTFAALDLSHYSLTFLDDGQGLEQLSYENDGSSMLLQMRLMVGHKWFEHLGVFGGVALNLGYSFDGQEDSEALAWGPSYRVERDDFLMRAWPGVFMGLQL